MTGPTRAARAQSGHASISETALDDGARRWEYHCSTGARLWSIEAHPERSQIWFTFDVNQPETAHHAFIAQVVSDAVETLPKPFDMVVSYGPKVAPFCADEIKSAAALISALLSAGLRSLVRVLSPQQEKSFHALTETTRGLSVSAHTVSAVEEATALLKRLHG